MKRKKFTGRVGRTVMDTDFQYEIKTKYPEGSPNVVYILLDDLGFAQLGCYGSNIHTPNIDQLAREGVMYNNFHTTAICSATRCSLLTGANHHSAGVNAVIEAATGCENGAGHIHSSYATIAEILKEYDYSTFAAGKWHLATKAEATNAGPFENWPLGKGFERYYGFLQGQMDQWHPMLVRDNTLLRELPGKEGYHFSVDMTDEAIEFISTQKNAYKDRPFFLYLAYGAMHSPHHAPKEYIERYKGAFDEGWDILRERYLKRQKELGVVPAEAELTPRNEYVVPWDSLSDTEKKVFCRYMEVYAGFLEHTDEQIGRVINYLKEIGELDHTIVVFLSDNGASPEGGQNGRFNMMNGMDLVSSLDDMKRVEEHLEEIGSEYSMNHYPAGWANLGNTPFPWYKTYVHSGGVKDPLIIRYPEKIHPDGKVRGQYHHVTDITPTVLDLLGLKKPHSIKGVPQKEFHGLSMVYTFEHADSPDRKHVQYYEMLGNRGIYKDGWKAVVNHTFSRSYEEDVWELYHVEEDYSECHNVAGQYPEKLCELKEEFLIEAGKYGVFPMVYGSFHTAPEQIGMLKYGKPIPYPEETQIFRNVYRSFDLNRPLHTERNCFTLESRFTRKEGENGVIFCSGDRFSGWVLYAKDETLHYVYNYQNEIWYRIDARKPLLSGKNRAALKYQFEEGRGKAVLYQNGEWAGEVLMEKINLMMAGQTTIGANKYTSVAGDYKVPFLFEGQIEEVKIHTAGFSMTQEAEISRFFAED